MDDAPLRVALVGYGLAGEVFHAPLIASTAGMVLTAVVTADGGRRARAARRFPDVRLLSAPDEIWADPSQFDLVVIASPNRAHVPLAVASVDAGVAVVVDKPAATTVADAIRLKEAATAGGIPVAVFHNRRWDGDFLTVRDLLETGALGRVHRFESRFERWRPEVAPVWRESADPVDGGGLLYDLGTHLIDQALVLFGPVESVYAELCSVRPGALVDDDTFVAMTHRSGTVTHLWASMVAADVGPRMRVLGTSASFTKFGLDVQERLLREGQDPGTPGWGLEPEDLWGSIRTGGDAFRVPTVAGQAPRFYELVADALCDRGPLPVGIDDAIATLHVIEAAQASAASGAVVAVSYDRSDVVR